MARLDLEVLAAALRGWIVEQVEVDDRKVFSAGDRRQAALQQARRARPQRATAPAVRSAHRLRAQPDASADRHQRGVGSPADPQDAGAGRPRGHGRRDVRKTRDLYGHCRLGGRLSAGRQGQPEIAERLDRARLPSIFLPPLLCVRRSVIKTPPWPTQKSTAASSRVL